MSGAAAAAAAPAVSAIPDPDSVDHVLVGVGLSGPAARLAGMLQAGFLTEAGWDPAARVLSPPAEHPLLGRALCRVGISIARADARSVEIPMACTDECDGLFRGATPDQ